MKKWVLLDSWGVSVLSQTPAGIFAQVEVESLGNCQYRLLESCNNKEAGTVVFSASEAGNTDALEGYTDDAESMRLEDTREDLCSLFVRYLQNKGRDLCNQLAFTLQSAGYLSSLGGDAPAEKGNDTYAKAKASREQQETEEEAEADQSSSDEDQPNESASGHPVGASEGGIGKGAGAAK